MLSLKRTVGEQQSISNASEKGRLAEAAYTRYH